MVSSQLWTPGSRRRDHHPQDAVGVDHGLVAVQAALRVGPVDGREEGVGQREGERPALGVERRLEHEHLVVIEREAPFLVPLVVERAAGPRVVDGDEPVHHVVGAQRGDPVDARHDHALDHHRERGEPSSQRVRFGARASRIGVETHDRDPRLGVARPSSSETMRNISVRISGSSRHQFFADAGRLRAQHHLERAVGFDREVVEVERRERLQPAGTGGPNGMMLTSGVVPRCPEMRYSPSPSIAALR